MLRKKILWHLSIILTVYSIGHVIHAQRDERFITQEDLQELISETQKEQCGIELSSDDLQEIRSINPKASWTFIVYMAADNNLHYFAWKNLKQMEQIGSNENVSIVVQLNTPGHLNPTKRYIIKKGRRLLVQDDDSPTEKLNSGLPITLINSVEWAVTHYPADNYALILWNHGTGAIDPMFARTVNPCDLFYVNPTDNKLTIDRGISYLTLIYQEAMKALHSDNKRGICFDDTFKSYISNHDLEYVLQQIRDRILNGKKLSLICFDACLMSMIEVASVCKRYADYFVTSQEVVYGTGWRYDMVLEPFQRGTLTPKQFASHIVLSYEQAYHKLINDYTLSALDLAYIEALELNIHAVAALLCEALQYQQNRNVTDIIRKCKSTQYCTCFDEPSYIDIAHFYQNLQQHIQHISLKDKAREQEVRNALQVELQTGLSLFPLLVVENKVGQKLRKAQGISVYFPEHTIAHNYLKSPFALQSQWGQLLTKYILG